MSDQRSYLERTYGPEVAERYSRVFRIAFFTVLLIALAGSLMVDFGVKTAQIRWTCAVLTGLGFAVLWRMRNSDIAYYKGKN